MGTTVVRRGHVEITSEKLSKLIARFDLLDGMKLERACYSKTEERGDGVRLFFSRNPRTMPNERRPNKRLCSMQEIAAVDEMTLEVLRLSHDPTLRLPKDATEPVIDVLLTDKEAHDLFSLGDRVEIRGVGSIWSKDGKTCLGFRLRCVEPV